MTRTVASLFFILIGMGAMWGATPPLYKIAVEAGLPLYGLLFWQSALMAICFSAYLLMRGRMIPLTAAALERYVMIALFGSVIPSFAAFTAVDHLPSSIMSILISTVPMLTLPIAATLGLDRFEPKRVLGLGLGLVGVAMLTFSDGLGDVSGAASVVWVLVALSSSLCYAIEGNYVASRGLGELDAISALCGASILGTVLVLPAMLASGDWISPLPPYDLPKSAFALSILIHVFTYSTYVWLLGRAGAVFASQVGYLVTLFGVFWAWVILGEVLPPLVLVALAVMLFGLFCVQPRPREALAAVAMQGHDDTGET